MSVKDILKTIKDKQIEYVDLRFTDPRGKLQHVTMDGKMVDDNSYTYCPKKGFTKIVSHKSGKMSMKISGNIKATGTK